MISDTAEKRPQPSPPVVALKDEVIAIRRDLHAHPELGFKEVRTSKVVADYLRKLGLEPRTGIAVTGVTADIVGDLPGPTILLRADMDALPIVEETGLPFSSSNENMHACGHDGHTAILLVTAKMLVERKNKLRGTVRVLFQPAEEGPGGAAPMIKEGVLEGVDLALGLHLWLHLPTGHVNFCPGPMLAATDEFDVTITGLGCHAASPHLGVDPIMVASHIVVNSPVLTSRCIDPRQPSVLSVTRFHSGGAYNVISPTATIGGTLRTYDESVRAELKTKFDKLCDGIAKTYGATCEVVWREGYPVLINDPRIAAICEEVLSESFHLKSPEDREDPRSMGGEDMAFYLQQVPGCFLFLGAHNEEVGACFGHHHPRFTIDEDSLPLGVELFLQCVDRLSREFQQTS